MPIKRSETPALTFIGGIYLAGGFDADTASHRYDPSADLWQELASLPYAVNHPGMVEFDGQVTLCGGYGADGRTAFDTMLALDRSDRTWGPAGTLPHEMGAFGMASIGDTIYIAGGTFDMLGGPATADVWSRSPDPGDWSPCPSMSIAREHLALVAVDGALFAIGGRAAGTDEATTGAVVERWRPGEPAWQRVADLPYPRSGLAGTTLNSGVVVAGGETSTKTFDSVDFYDPATDSWSTLPALPFPVHGMGLAAVDNVLFAIGGSTVAGQVSSVNTTWKLDVMRSTQPIA
jgi:N-acetylneuraminic acid mutarotase